jgi:4-diphosphocytidyl-2-C-methyl-D-erythritol kinase
MRARALAKINLDLRVLEKRADGFHELRTIFQTISLADDIEITFEVRRTTSVEVDDGGIGIPDNLAARAARMAMEAMRVRGRVEIRLRKQIPMGAGLGGGSSDAAAILLALPALAGRRIPFDMRVLIARELGSDVGFFLLGGTAVGIGRGDELFPLQDRPPRTGILIAPGLHVDTAQAYRDLSPKLRDSPIAEKRQTFQRSVAGMPGENDFEPVVFEQHPPLRRLKKRLMRAGAVQAMMTGSGSALFGFFEGDAPDAAALKLNEGERLLPFSTVSRARYSRMWRRWGVAFDNYITSPLKS